ncbi:MAG: site-specific integrase [Chromatiaceae bacterium]|nr:site-specific integrase [Chromatiaceae bacterium]
MATIRKLEGNRTKPWRVEIRRQGKRIGGTFRTKREASEFAAKVEADFSKWSRLLGSELRRHTLADLIDRYVNQWKGKDHNTPSRLAWWRAEYGDRPLSDFTDETMREAMARLETDPGPPRGNSKTPQNPRAGATVNRYKAAISACFKTAIDKGWFGLTMNPAAGIRGRKEGSNRFGRALEDTERSALLTACDQSPWPALGVFVRLALATGARRGELLKLEWRDVDLIKGSILLRDTKNSDDRRVPLVAEVRQRLIIWSKVRKLDDPRVFPGAARDRPPQIDKAWSAAKQAAGIENLRLHDLRHSCGSYLARAGASAFQIAAVLGHRSGPGLTARYVHLGSDENRELLEGALADVFTGREP